MQTSKSYIQSSRHTSDIEEQAFLRVISVAVEAVLKGTPHSSASPSASNAISEIHKREELVQILEAIQLPDSLSYMDVYKMMQDYANTTATGVTLYDRDVTVPLNFTAFEIIYKHLATVTPRVAVIPPIPHSFVAK
ncbi:Hypothetical protein GLP15_4540 [Giardia lamblia P15]|uniref:Uncharacterized protein n=1 Tax=Giardia intestinalis (strain P15) TaxID=658858 RepID=E1F3E8_GIAIA|nr:Hypothetical protein GLP15_4540 [Giardia lamblia P15]